MGAPICYHVNLRGNTAHLVDLGQPLFSHHQMQTKQQNSFALMRLFWQPKCYKMMLSMELRTLFKQDQYKMECRLRPYYNLLWLYAKI